MVCLAVLVRVWCLWLRVQGFEDGGVDGGDGVRLFLGSQIPGQHLRLYALQCVLNLLRLILSDLVLVLNFIAIMFILENGGDHCRELIVVLLIVFLVRACDSSASE